MRYLFNCAEFQDDLLRIQGIVCERYGLVLPPQKTDERERRPSCTSCASRAYSCVSAALRKVSDTSMVNGSSMQRHHSIDGADVSDARDAKCFGRHHSFSTKLCGGGSRRVSADSTRARSGSFSTDRAFTFPGLPGHRLRRMRSASVLESSGSNSNKHSSARRVHRSLSLPDVRDVPGAKCISELEIARRDSDPAAVGSGTTAPASVLHTIQTLDRASASPVALQSCVRVGGNQLQCDSSNSPPTSRGRSSSLCGNRRRVAPMVASDSDGEEDPTVPAPTSPKVLPLPQSPPLSPPAETESEGEATSGDASFVGKLPSERAISAGNYAAEVASAQMAMAATSHSTSPTVAMSPNQVLSRISARSDKFTVPDAESSSCVTVVASSVDRAKKLVEVCTHPESRGAPVPARHDAMSAKAFEPAAALAHGRSIAS